MEKRIKKIEWKGERFDLPCPIYVDLDELSKKFFGHENRDMILFLFMKSITEWIKKERKEEEYDKFE